MNNISDAERLSKALTATTNVAGGIFLGGIAGARGDSATSNIVVSALAGLAASGIDTMLGGHAFLSKQTLATTLTITASSAIMRLFTKSAAERHHEPQIAFAPSCGCKHKAWAERVSNVDHAAGISR